MDRQAFLSSMPFLVPCPSAAWPPHRSNSDGMSTRVEPMLPLLPDSSYKFKLSIEAAVAKMADGSNQHELQKVQPAFFGRPEDGSVDKSNFDPAAAEIQVAVESSSCGVSGSQDDSSVLKGRVLFVGGNSNDSGSSAKSQTPSSTTKITPESMQLSLQRLPNSWPLFLFFKIDKQGVFQVDDKQLLHVEVIYCGEGAKSELPPSLILVFPSAVFRIYPLHCPSVAKPVVDSDASQIEWKAEALASLRSLEKQIIQLSNNSSNNSPWSPCESSFPSSKAEAGQKDGGFPSPSGGQSHSHSTLTSSSSSSRPQTKKLKTVKGVDDTDDDKEWEDCHLIRKAKRRRDALIRSRSGIKSVEAILAMPVSVVKADHILPRVQLETQALPLTDSAASDSAMPKTQGYQGPRHEKVQSPALAMGPLLTGIAEDLSASFSTNVERKAVLQSYMKEIEEHRCDRMDQLLDSFFPGMPQRHASGRPNRNTRHKEAPNGNVTAPARTKPTEEVIESIRRLMKKQRDLVDERSTFLQLPTRG